MNNGKYKKFASYLVGKYSSELIDKLVKSLV